MEMLHSHKYSRIMLWHWQSLFLRSSITPTVYGLAVNNAGSLIFVADRDENIVRQIYCGNGSCDCLICNMADRMIALPLLSLGYNLAFGLCVAVTILPTLMPSQIPTMSPTARPWWKFWSWNDALSHSLHLLILQYYQVAVSRVSLFKICPIIAFVTSDEIVFLALLL
jgi:hypothetical protein